MSDHKATNEIFTMVETLLFKSIQEVNAIHLGRLNPKWILTFTDGTKLFVKQYHPDRYIGKIPAVKQALSIQDQLFHKGIQCPKVHSVNREYILHTKSNHQFSMFEVCPGILVLPGKPNQNQMYSWGKELGKMHHLLDKVPAGPIDWIPSKEEIQSFWELQMKIAEDYPVSYRVQKMLEKEQELLELYDQTFFDQCKHGWAHWDNQVYNVLFQRDAISSILDFDRMRYVYPELDVARAILSGCIDNETKLDEEKARAFITGYQETIKEFQLNDVIRSFKLLWCRESVWWIKADIEQDEEIPQRFSKEIEWLQNNWSYLEDILC
ncbi:phosphotransferase [Shimazuella alba]|uniref:Phosphotransferase n=1 Tax=Shimazuella alba TaxID=2690964 RepID=A0A6I4VXI1_9BACL|nr:phosphotransferase [Shimazuella alba]MXQ55288.1 phosphotransferase [Shimazuella alba]